MLEEIEIDTRKDALYLSPWLTQKGQGDWADHLREAAANGSDDTLGRALRESRLINATAVRRKPGGYGYTTYRIPCTAHETLAEGEFNRFYVRGLCRRALAEGIECLEVYRAKEVSEPRPESWRRIGTLMDPQPVLVDIRVSVSVGVGVETAIGMPQGPNSGLTLRIPLR